mgnify:CR=1 FL=1
MDGDGNHGHGNNDGKWTGATALGGKLNTAFTDLGDFCPAGPASVGGERAIADHVAPIAVFGMRHDR